MHASPSMLPLCLAMVQQCLVSYLGWQAIAPREHAKPPGFAPEPVLHAGC